MERAGPCVEQGGPPGRRASRPTSPDSLSALPLLPDFLPHSVSLTPRARARSPSLSPRLAAGDELELELVPRIEDGRRGMEPMNVDNGGLDAQIEQLMQCRPLAEQEVRSSPAMRLCPRSIRVYGSLVSHFAA
jgi:serine/threonine-protein phosphatase 2A catalytic subunit